MIPVLVALGAAIITVVAAGYVDQRLLRCQSPARLALALWLLGIDVWLVVVMQAALWLHTPGAYGPVQFWVNSPGALDFFQVRAWALFLILGGGLVFVISLIVTPVAMCEGNVVSRLWRGVIPAIAFTLYLVAFVMFFQLRFFPTA